MSIHPGVRRQWFTLVLILAIFYVTWTHVSWVQISHLDISALHPAALRAPTAYSPEFVNFWRPFAQALVETEPPVDVPSGFDGAHFIGFDQIDSSYALPNQLEMPLAKVSEMQVAHARFVAKLRPGALSTAPYVAGTQGIVTSAAGNFLPVLVVSLRLLRRTGSTLPVEVFLEQFATADAESDICVNVLPKLNARCVPMAPFFAISPIPEDVTHYQIKAFAFLFSTFEDILWLDADNIAVSPPERLFQTEVYRQHGLVAWPDYWGTTASADYYTISAIRPAPSPMDRAASESGQLLISKRVHATTMLLMAYYNYYGPSHFYPLLSQGAIGQGDKETFVAAAQALAAPFYTVQSKIGTAGYQRKSNGEFRGTAALQHHPQDDYEHHALGKTLNTPDAKPRQMFVHCQTIKADAAKMPLKYSKDVKQRMWGPPEAMIAKFGTDLEKDLWDELRYTACELEHDFDAWKNKTGVCDATRTVYRALFEDGSFD
ncbi:MAG: hypothetical protein M1838_001986 [Thelocarpon superellum]|nr:MAG: hypothetical protein M1838_001986 [Thelocarpon superellum]